MGNSVHKAMSSLNTVIAFEHNYKRLQHRHSHKLECMAHMAWKMQNDQILSPAHIFQMVLHISKAFDFEWPKQTSQLLRYLFPRYLWSVKSNEKLRSQGCKKRNQSLADIVAAKKEKGKRTSCGRTKGYTLLFLGIILVTEAYVESFTLQDTRNCFVTNGAKKVNNDREQ